MRSQARYHRLASGAFVAASTAIAVAASNVSSLGGEASLAPAPGPGDPVDLAAFGRIESDTNGVAVEWDAPREVSEIVIRSRGPALSPEALRIDWWGSVWPAHGTGGWMKLDDLEDNIFFSWQSGYNVSDYERTWFERGGITLQPCLLDTPAVYMARDEMPAALRAFWNTYALSVYPDVHCFAEWAPRFGQGGGPVYKTSDESRFVIWMRQLLVQEDDDRLLLGRGAPRAWLAGPEPVEVRNAPTWFGPMSLRLEPGPGGEMIRAAIDPPRRNPPRETWLRLRHPDSKLPRRVRVNGVELARGRVLGEDIDLTPGPGGPPPDAAGTLQLVAEY